MKPFRGRCVCIPSTQYLPTVLNTDEGVEYVLLITLRQDYSTKCPKCWTTEFTELPAVLNSLNQFYKEGCGWFRPKCILTNWICFCSILSRLIDNFAAGFGGDWTACWTRRQLCEFLTHLLCSRSVLTLLKKIGHRFLGVYQHYLLSAES